MRKHKMDKAGGAKPSAEPRPRIVAFCCENSAYKAAEPVRNDPLLKAVDLVKVPCAGDVDIPRILERLEQGVEQVLVLGCPIDNCQYISGNRRTRKRVAAARRALKDLGMNEDRVRMEFLSSVDTHKFVAILEKARAWNAAPPEDKRKNEEKKKP